MIFRPALEADLRAVYEVFYQNELVDNPQLPALGETPSYFRHILQTGTLYVAEQDRAIHAFAGAITRGTISFLTDLFVRPTHQSGQLGKTLLRSVFPQDKLVHCTVSSSDPRALALYIRSGMRPQWPYFALRRERATSKLPLTSDVEMIEADPHDPELVRWDAQVCGRLRPVEHRYWIDQQEATPFWFRRRQQIVGYGYVRLKTINLLHPDACVLGPIGVKAPEDATACVLAAMNRGLQHAETLHIDVPGPHPCLVPLLESGFRIAYVDTFVSSTNIPFFDAQCYIPSGGDLL